MSMTTTLSSASSSSPSVSRAGSMQVFPVTPNGATPAVVTSPATVASNEVLEKLLGLKTLFESGFITLQEFEERREQLINQLTGTQLKKARLKAISKKDEIPQVVPKEPPKSFADWPQERAKLYTFDTDKGEWHAQEIMIRVDNTPFARGNLRLCYYASLDRDPDHSDGEADGEAEEERGDHNQVYVAKLSIDPFEERQTYFTDVQIQMYSRLFAERFNAYDPPKQIQFLKAWLVELVDRKGSPMCGIEKFIRGPYRKHNNNFGYVSDLERNTPQAFSHFTYVASEHRLLVCDIQGVDDVYTDPQVHTSELPPPRGKKSYAEFLQGKGNMGQRGIESFLSGHKCNAICRYLRLPAVGDQVVDDSEVMGTMPSQRFMTLQQVKAVDFRQPQSYDDAVASVSASASPSTALLKKQQSADDSSSSCCCCTLL